MNRIRKKSAPYDLMAIFESLGVEKGLSIVQPAGTEQLLADVRSALDAARHNPIMVHGRRVQSMFSFVVSSLGSAALVKDEDSGETYTTDAAIKVPDCFVALKDGRSFLVEVKNNHHGPQKPYRITNSYLDALTRYATLVQRPLRFAIYWSKANIWTLISADRLPPSVDGKVLLDFGTAMKRNEMADLGDAQLGTTPPLALRVAFHAPMQRALEEPA